MQGLPSEWRLFGLIVVPMTVAVLVAMAQRDMATGQAVSELVTLSVRLAVPWLFIAFAASSLLVLVRNPVTRWIMQNRKIIGLCYAAGMGWQLFFIAWLLFAHFDLYMERSYSPVALFEQVPGYAFLIAMTVTSFKFGRSRLTGRQWRLLHRVGIYWLWAVTWTTYWYELFYYDDRQVIDYVYYWMGFAAWGVRVLAWIKSRAPVPGSERRARLRFR
jgi:hypothetical protein